MKNRIRDMVRDMGVDDVGFAAVSDYRSPRSPRIESIMPAAKSIIVMAFKELSSCESPNKTLAMNGRLDVMEFARSCSYRLGRFLEREFHARVVTVPISYPLVMSKETMGSVGEVSLRHAAIAAGLGVFGRHNLVLHPVLGSRVLFTAILCDLELPSDPPCTEDLCNQCNLCVEECPAGALDEEGYTDVNKCLKISQPWGIGGNLKFWMKFIDSPPEQQKKMFIDPEYWRLYQANALGFQYHCFNCLNCCPIGRDG